MKPCTNFNRRFVILVFVDAETCFLLSHIFLQQIKKPRFLGGAVCLKVMFQLKIAACAQPLLDKPFGLNQ